MIAFIAAHEHELVLIILILIGMGYLLDRGRRN